MFSPVPEQINNISTETGDNLLLRKKGEKKVYSASTAGDTAHVKQPDVCYSANNSTFHRIYFFVMNCKYLNPLKVWGSLKASTK